MASTVGEQQRKTQLRPAREADTRFGPARFAGPTGVLPVAHGSQFPRAQPKGQMGRWPAGLALNPAPRSGCQRHPIRAPPRNGCQRLHDGDAHHGHGHGHDLGKGLGAQTAAWPSLRACHGASAKALHPDEPQRPRFAAGKSPSHNQPAGAAIQPAVCAVCVVSGVGSG